MSMHHRFLCFAALALLSLQTVPLDTTWAQEDGTVAPGDSLKTYSFGEVLVAAPSLEVIAAPGETEIPAQVLDDQDVESAEDLAPLLPAARISTNSRGEANLTLRGASERQVAIFQDGVRLNLPWDERIDLSLVPMEAAGTIRVSRGLTSVLDGPNTMGGVAHILSRRLDDTGSRTRVLLEAGEVSRLRGGLVHTRRTKDWSWLGAVERRQQDGFLLPADLEDLDNQGSGRNRTNADVEQSSVFLRVARHLQRDGSIAVSFHGMDSRKGVPPETHVGDDARFWRVPKWRRGIASLQADFVPDEERLWRFAGSLSLDVFEQDIRDYTDATYTEVQGGDEASLSRGEDVGGEMRLRLTRTNDRRRTRNLSWAGSVRWTEHVEEEAGVRDEFSQVLWGAAMEWDGRTRGPWSLRAGFGLDGSSTPKTGGRPEQSADVAPKATLRLSRDVGEEAQLHAVFGRSSRFPSLRERYSDAGSVFLENPDLDPETQSTLELGGGFAHETASFSAGVFGSILEDGIIRVRVTTPDGESFRRRVNEDEIRSLGLEMSGQWNVTPTVALDGHFTAVRVRAKAEDGEFTARVERKSSWSSALVARIQLPKTRGLELQTEGIFQGPFYSLDDNTGDLAEIDATLSANVRLAYRWTPSSRTPLGGTVFVRVDNVADTEILSQLGLPRAGRQVRAGVRLEK